MWRKKKSLVGCSSSYLCVVGLVAFHCVLCPFVVIFQMVTIPCCHLLSLSLYTRNMTSVEFFHPTFTLYNVFVSSLVCWACPQNKETVLKTLLFVPNVPLCFVSVASLTLTPPQEEEKAAPSASKKPAKGRPLLSREKSADSSSTSSSASAEKQRQEARKRLLAAKKAASFRQNSATESADSIEIYVPEAQTRLWKGREDRQTDRRAAGRTGARGREATTEGVATRRWISGETKGQECFRNANEPLRSQYAGVGGWGGSGRGFAWWVCRAFLTLSQSKAGPDLIKKQKNY